MLVLSLLIPAFISGFLMFLAPCTLPIVPGYLAFVSGVRLSDENNPEARRLAHTKIKKNSLFFVLGFSLIFILLGILLGFFGSVLGVSREILLQVSGVLVIMFGLMMLGVFSFSFFKRQFTIKLPSWFRIGTPKSSFLIGGIFALGWSPCIGPILGTLLVLAGTLGTAFQGALLLAVFSLGLAVPFLISAALYTRSQNFFLRYSVLFKVFSIIGGLLLVLIGVLLLLNEWSLFQEWGFEIFKFLDYESLKDYL